MADRNSSGICKLFTPNYFNPTKCQNCFKQKNQHTIPQDDPVTKNPLTKKSSSLGKNVVSPSTILKESILSKAIVAKEDEVPKTWNDYFFSLKSNGELLQYEVENKQVKRDRVLSSIMLQEFIRMLDGKVEIGEDLCFGVKTLRETTYFKTKTKVDYENWWKEFGSFVAAPIRRTTSAASALRHSRSTTSPPGYNKPSRVQKQFSVPTASILSKLSSRQSRSSSISSSHSDPDHPQMDVLRNQVSKLEEENSKLTKAEEQRRKLELEVNYWKEYVTNSQAVKRSGGTLDTTSELADTRQKLIQAQDELNETQKKLKTNQGKLLIQNKELSDVKDRLRESNSIIAVYKAKIEHISKEPNALNDEKPPVDSSVTNSTTNVPTESKSDSSSSAQHLEDKFLVLKDRLKRIEKELVLKSKELEKANESRSKVAKYTRSLLQELETRLSDNQRKLTETEEKLKNVSTELSMERERRMKLEEGPRRRMSSVASPPRPGKVDGDTNELTSESGEVEFDAKYADYYRSRFKEAEASLLEKDMKLHQAEEKIKELQLAMKSNSDSYKVINELQTKLSDATHKLSDRQLKIHELTRETDRLKEFEKTYMKKNKRCDTLEEMVKELEKSNNDQKRSLHQVKQELEMTKIREVVLHEQIEAFVGESEESDEEGEDHDLHLGKSIDLKNKIECMIELEALAKKRLMDNEKLTARNNELETRLRNINIESFKTLEAQKSIAEDTYANADKEFYEKTIKELKQQLASSEDKYCREFSHSKEKYLKELAEVEKKFLDEKTEQQQVLDQLKSDSEKREKETQGDCDELQGKLTMLQLKYDDLEDKVKTTVSHDDKPSISEENTSLKMKINQLEHQLRLSTDKFEDVITSLKEKGSKLESGKKERDSGIVITQEIKGIIDSFDKDVTSLKHTALSRQESDDIFMTPRTSISSESESPDKLKKLCINYDLQLKELSKKLFSSEEKVISLAEELEQQLLSEDDHVSKYNALVSRIDDLQSQIMDSQEALQSKADELERERKNVINLVEVTSTYIKELELSVAESKVKIQDLQGRLNIKHGRQPPDGQAENIVDSKPPDATSSENEAQLTATILRLQSDLSELKVRHEGELNEARSSVKHNIHKQDAISEESEDLTARVQELEEQLKEQQDIYTKDVAVLQQSFQKELKTAFSGDSAGIDMLNRVQELEMELDNTRKEHDNKSKELHEQYEKEKEQLKDDMAMVIQASLSAQFESSPVNNSQTELEERIVQLEQQLIEMEEQYQEELNIEKDAHQKEMEDTIRDVMVLRNSSTNYDGDGKDTTDNVGNLDGIGLNQSPLKKLVSVEEVASVKKEYEDKLEAQLEEHEQELAQVRDDMALIINSIKQGSSSDTIMDLQNKVKDMEIELEKVLKKHKREKKDLEQQVNKLDSKNFFAMRRNEEMGGKIFQMQIDSEEMERKHQLEIDAYQAKFSAISGDSSLVDSGVHESMKLQEDLKERIRQLEKDLEDIQDDHEDEIEAITLQIQQEKQEAIEEMTDKVLKLEELIDELKEHHREEINQYERLDRKNNLNSTGMDVGERIKELEAANENLKEEYEEEIEELIIEHKKEVEKLRVFYEKEIGEMKKRSSSDADSNTGSHSRKASVDYTSLKQSLREQKEQYEKDIVLLKEQHTSEKEAMRESQQREINDIRTQYDEKLKMSYKEGLRRQSVTERKSDATKIKELITEKELYQTKLLELEIKYDTDTKELNERLVKLQGVIAELKVHKEGEGVELSKQTIESLAENEHIVEDEMQRKIKEISEQIERYERRIEYYREKSLRENTEESHRVAELQSEIVELHKNMKSLKESMQKQVYEKEKREKAPGSKMPVRRNTDGSTALPRRHTDTDAAQLRSKVLRDPKKRWSDLEERPKREDNKSGSVLARKTLWESITIDEPTASDKTQRLTKQSAIK